MLSLWHRVSDSTALSGNDPTPMFLDPVLPGVGGQLGGTFELDLTRDAMTTLAPESPSLAQAKMTVCY